MCLLNQGDRAYRAACGAFELRRQQNKTEARNVVPSQFFEEQVLDEVYSRLSENMLVHRQG